mmetsp:Transcript_16176/g.22717  ORF Transcript_16176/g.22717 Transcript_16176/m.22717 type:complete len:86 (+) Transcript_16176:240-497(+)
MRSQSSDATHIHNMYIYNITASVTARTFGNLHPPPGSSNHRASVMGIRGGGGVRWGEKELRLGHKTLNGAAMSIYAPLVNSMRLH